LHSANLAQEARFMYYLATVTKISVRWLGRALSSVATLIWALILLDILACDALIGLVNVAGKWLSCWRW